MKAAERAGPPPRSLPDGFVVYEYVTDDTQSIQDIAKYCNQRSAEGWEFVQSVAMVGSLANTTRWVVIHRRPRV